MRVKTAMSRCNKNKISEETNTIRCLKNGVRVELSGL